MQGYKLLAEDLRYPLYVNHRGMLFRYQKMRDEFVPVAMRRKIVDGEAVHNYFRIEMGGKQRNFTQPDLKKFYEEEKHE